MIGLLISPVAPGVARACSADPFDSLVVHRIDREMWAYVPDESGVYLLYGSGPDGKVTIYVGMSRRSMRARVRSHFVNPAKSWFGVLFAVPIASPLLCAVVEAELIAAVTKAGVVDVVENRSTEDVHLGAETIHAEAAVHRIRFALQLLLGEDIFTTAEVEHALRNPVARLATLAREYRGAAAKPRARTLDDLDGATHVFAQGVVAAWGRFEAEEPDKHFRVLKGSSWRRAVRDCGVAQRPQFGVDAVQDELVKLGVLAENPHVFSRDHVFKNWSVAAQVARSATQYTGAYNWMRLTD